MQKPIKVEMYSVPIRRGHASKRYCLVDLKSYLFVLSGNCKGLGGRRRINMNVTVAFQPRKCSWTNLFTIIKAVTHHTHQAARQSPWLRGFIFYNSAAPLIAEISKLISHELFRYNELSTTPSLNESAVSLAD